MHCLHSTLAGRSSLSQGLYIRKHYIFITYCSEFSTGRDDSLSFASVACSSSGHSLLLRSVAASDLCGQQPDWCQ